MSKYRKNKVERRIREILSNLFLFKVKDPILRCLYITSVRAANDIKMAKVYYRIQVTKKAPQDRKVVEKALQRAMPYVRSAMGGELGTKYTPELLFYYDDTLDEVARINKIFDEIEEQRQLDGLIDPEVDGEGGQEPGHYEELNGDQDPIDIEDRIDAEASTDKEVIDGQT